MAHFIIILISLFMFVFPVEATSLRNVRQSGVTSTDNSTTTPLSGSATYTGTGEQNDYPQVGVYAFADQDGTLYFDWSVDGTNWHAFPTAGHAVSASIPEFHTAVKLGRYFRVRFINGSSAQSTFRLTTYFGDGFVPSVSPLNQSIGLDNDALAVRGNNFYDEVARGLRSGVSKWNKFGYNDDIDTATDPEVIWANGATFTPLTSAETFDIAYDGTAGGSTDGNGTTGCTQLTFYYLDSNGYEAIAAHNLGTDGTDTTSFNGYGINRIVCSATGTNDVNVSDITITATTSGTQQAIMPAGTGVSQQVIFFVGSNRQANAKWLFISADKSSGGGSPKVTFKIWVWNRGVDSKFEVFRFIMDTSVSDVLSIEDPLGFTLNATDVIWIEAETSANDTEASARLSLISYQN